MEKSNSNYIRRWRRKKLLQNIIAELEPCNVKAAYAHTHFVMAEEKRPKNITIYVEIEAKSDNVSVNRADMSMDAKFKRKNITIIDVATLQPAIKDFVFQDLTKIL
ncbi:MAG: hypothetical protein LBL74_04010 [Bacteroidales bacterium]|jgi:hypothetical protein|nr:hypothetical protein [Bacteroidales bacterium]